MQISGPLPGSVSRRTRLTAPHQIKLLMLGTPRLSRLDVPAVQLVYRIDNFVGCLLIQIQEGWIREVKDFIRRLC